MICFKGVRLENESSLWSWLFGGTGTLFVGWLAARIFRNLNKESELISRDFKIENSAKVKNNNSNVTTVVINSAGASGNSSNFDSPGTRAKVDKSQKKHFLNIDDAKANLIILFVDDKKFRVIDTLKMGGWSHVESILDVFNIADDNLKKADFIFVDIQGVGKKLGFKDEGLGLAKAIIDRYPNKYLVIYSAVPKGDRFHEALRKADDILNKNSDDYEFEKCILNLVIDEK